LVVLRTGFGLWRHGGIEALEFVLGERRGERQKTFRRLHLGLGLGTENVPQEAINGSRQGLVVRAVDEE
jgi:hypothetical protein